MLITRVCRSLMLSVLASVAFFATPSRADAINCASYTYCETFDSGKSLNTDSLVNFASIDSYWTSTVTDQNGNVVQSTNSVGSFGNAIAADASGSGYFLFEGTAADSSSRNLFDSSSFAVTPNTDYTITFELVNATSCNQEPYGFANCSAQIQLLINGVDVASAVSADNDTPAQLPEPWQQFTFSWNSGVNTTASLGLQDLFTGVDGFGSGTGNDFGVDNILVAPTQQSTAPEPGTIGLTLLALPYVFRALKKKR